MTMSAGQFTDIELICLGHLAKGRSIEDLCAALAMTEAAVQALLDDVEMKLGARNRLHAVILALRLGLVEEANE